MSWCIAAHLNEYFGRSAPAITSLSHSFSALKPRMCPHANAAFAASSYVPNGLDVDALIMTLDASRFGPFLHRFDQSSRKSATDLSPYLCRTLHLAGGLICLNPVSGPCAEYEFFRPGKGNEVSDDTVIFARTACRARMVAIWLMEPHGLISEPRLTYAQPAMSTTTQRQDLRG